MRRWAATTASALLDATTKMSFEARGVVICIFDSVQQEWKPALDVADACSGMRLLLAFLALGVAMAYLHYRPLWQRLILLASTIPTAIFCNIVRVTATGFIYILVDPKYTQGIYHDLLGMAMLPLAFGLYGLLAWFMASLFVEESDGFVEDIVVRRKDA
jgi:exosortase